MHKTLFDPRCHELAKFFCEDAGVDSPEMIDELAGLIQEVIEDFLDGGDDEEEDHV
jgi:hypothetical protein